MFVKHVKHKLTLNREKEKYKKYENLYLKILNANIKTVLFYTIVSGLNLQWLFCRGETWWYLWSMVKITKTKKCTLKFNNLNPM